jgi:hypothetical protein
MVKAMISIMTRMKIAEHMAISGDACCWFLHDCQTRHDARDLTSLLLIHASKPLVLA